MIATDLRIALFSGNYNYVRDGANQALNRLVGHVLEAGAAVRVYSPTVADPAFAPTGPLVSVPSIAIPGGRGEYRVGLGATPAVRRDLRAFAPNLVHVSAPELLGHSATRWARLRGIPVVASVHTRFETYLGYYGLERLQPVLEYMLARFYNRVDRVVVPGEGMRTLLQGWGVETPIAIWSRGVDHARFSPTHRDLGWRRSLGIGDDEVAIGFVGRLVLEKGLDIFADVAAELRRRGVAHRVLVIGDGPARGWFAERVPDAIFAGFLSGDALGRAIASTDIFFNPSVTETFGNVTLEAMAAGVPVVAARATGSAGLVDDGVTGRLVTPRDVAGHADALARYATDPAARRAAGHAGHERARRYRWDSANQAVLDTYLELLG